MNKKLILIISAVILLIATVSIAFFQGKDKKIIVGHSGGPLLGTLYLAKEESEWKSTFDDTKFNTSSDTAYALLSGDIDFGFVETSKISALKQLGAFDKLTTIGKLSFPYGATLVLRKDLQLRLSDLNNHVIGVTSNNCKLLKAFKEDASRLGVDISTLEYKIIPFDTMLPALEAREIDAAVTKGAYAVIAQNEGHQVLYQNWEVVPGDECCPPTVDQTEFIILARKDIGEAANILTQLLLNAQSKDADTIRNAIVKNTKLSQNVLSNFPTAEFSEADNTLIDDFADHDHDEEDDHDHDHDEDDDHDHDHDD